MKKISTHKKQSHQKQPHQKQPHQKSHQKQPHQKQLAKSPDKKKSIQKPKLKIPQKTPKKLPQISNKNGSSSTSCQTFDMMNPDSIGRTQLMKYNQCRKEKCNPEWTEYSQDLVFKIKDALKNNNKKKTSPKTGKATEILTDSMISPPGVKLTECGRRKCGPESEKLLESSKRNMKCFCEKYNHKISCENQKKMEREKEPYSDEIWSRIIAGRL